MALDYSKIWGTNGIATKPDDANILAGFEFLGQAPPTEALFNWLFQNIDFKLQNLYKTSRQWQASTAYSVGDIVYSENADSYKYFECTVAGTSGTTEPTWPAVGSTIADGTVTWIARDLRIATAQFDTSNKLATAAWVRNELGTRIGIVDTSTSLTLTAANIGKIIHTYSANTTLTLPAANSVPAGSRICFWQSDAFTATVVRAGTDTIVLGTTTTATSLTLAGSNMTAELISNGSSSWVLVSGSALLQYCTLFKKLAAGNGYEYSASGVIDQWGTFTSSGSAANTITFPTTFPSTAYQLIIMPQGVGNGYILNSISASGFSVDIRNASGFVSTSTRWYAKGE